MYGHIDPFHRDSGGRVIVSVCGWGGVGLVGLSQHLYQVNSEFTNQADSCDSQCGDKPETSMVSPAQAHTGQLQRFSWWLPTEEGGQNSLHALQNGTGYWQWLNGLCHHFYTVNFHFSFFFGALTIYNNILIYLY